MTIDTPPLAGPSARSSHAAVSDTFVSGLHAACLMAPAVCLAGAFFVLACLPARPLSGVRS